VDEELGEQCDAGTANGTPGTCCDATCRVAAAGSVCRVAAAACLRDAVCDGVSSACPQSTPRIEGELCDDGDPATGTSACVANVCRGVEIELVIDPEIPVPPNPKQAAIPILITLPSDGAAAVTSVQVQGFVACGDVPVLEGCTTKACRDLERQLAQYCPASTATTLARRGKVPSAPSGLVPVTKSVKQKIKRSKRGQVEVKLKLNKLGQALLARSSTLPLQARAQIQDRQGSVLNALFRTLLRRR